jgi:hypothetical protein
MPLKLVSIIIFKPIITVRFDVYMLTLVAVAPKNLYILQIISTSNLFNRPSRLNNYITPTLCSYPRLSVSFNEAMI